MFSMETKLLYHFWANKTILEHIQQIGEKYFFKNVKSVFPSIAAVFEHVYQVDRMWANRINGEKTSRFEEQKFKNTKEALNSFEELWKEYKKNSLKKGLIIYKNTLGIEFKNEISEIFEHVINHGTYHRGNVTAMLHQLEQKSIATDLILFLREQNEISF